MFDLGCLTCCEARSEPLGCLTIGLLLLWCHRLLYAYDLPSDDLSAIWGLMHREKGCMFYPKFVSEGASNKDVHYDKSTSYGCGLSLGSTPADSTNIVENVQEVGAFNDICPISNHLHFPSK